MNERPLIEVSRSISRLYIHAKADGYHYAADAYGRSLMRIGDRMTRALTLPPPPAKPTK